MRSRISLLCVFALAALFFTAGCERGDRVGFTAEIDDPGYRRGKDLLRQGRNQEALGAFLKVIEKRGEDAPESHLEVGLLYQQHIKDPIAAIYHFRKFRELKPNSPQSDLVRQRIDAATREFARTLPGQPLDNAVSSRFDNYDQVERYQRENEALKAELATLRTQIAASGGSFSPSLNTRRPPDTTPVMAPSNAPEEESPIIRAPMEDAAPVAAAPTPTPARAPAATASNQTPGIRTAVPVTPTRPSPFPVPGGRRHVVGKGDTLFSLAAKYYGDRGRWREIYAANRNVMKSENDLRMGAELKIP